LKEDLSAIDINLLYTAAIFHDIGYGKSEDKTAHAEKSTEIFEEYARNHHLDINFTNKVAYLIKMHSNKRLLKDSDTIPELVILMEADLLDEEGALRVVWYCATKALQGADHYKDFVDYVQMGSAKRLENPMVTPLAKEIWNRKMELAERFMEEVYADIDMDISFL